MTLFQEYRACRVELDETAAEKKIKDVIVRNVRNGQDNRLCAPVFADCSGVAVLAKLAGAPIRSGREARAEFGEGLAPETADAMHHGNTVFFRTRMADRPVDFPKIPWAVEIAKDYADLGGQLCEPGHENCPGPFVGEPKPAPTLNAEGTFFEKPMDLPCTHFWEYGQWMDAVAEGERIRDHLLCAIYGTFSNVKTMESEKNANLVLDWVAFVPAHGEYDRIVGDYILTENDIRGHKEFPDAVVLNSEAFCLHYPGDERHDFRLKNWIWDVRDGEPYAIPFRCLYSAGVSNLMMGGKHISVTHIAGSSTKMIGNGGQHGIAIGAAAALCKKYGATPREIGKAHMDELREAVKSVTA